MTIRTTRILLALVLGLLFLATPTSHTSAAPSTDIWTHFYDCSLSIVGEKFRGCDSTGYNWGQLSGAFKEIESCSCEGTTCRSSWYQWNGSVWVYIGTTAPSPTC